MLPTLPYRSGRLPPSERFFRALTIALALAFATYIFVSESPNWSDQPEPKNVPDR